MAPDSRRWWTEMAIGLGTTALLAVTLVVLLGPLFGTSPGTTNDIDGLAVLLPALAGVVWAARRYRRRHAGGGRGPA